VWAVSGYWLLVVVAACARARACVCVCGGGGSDRLRLCSSHDDEGDGKQQQPVARHVEGSGASRVEPERPHVEEVDLSKGWRRSTTTWCVLCWTQRHIGNETMSRHAYCVRVHEQLNSSNALWGSSYNAGIAAAMMRLSTAARRWSWRKRRQKWGAGHAVSVMSNAREDVGYTSHIRSTSS
jgi:hypothetical protein